MENWQKDKQREKRVKGLNSVTKKQVFVNDRF